MAAFPFAIASIVFTFAASSTLAAANHRPTISWIPDQRVVSSDADPFKDQVLFIQDNESTLTASSVTVVSSNASWYPANKIHPLDAPLKRKSLAAFGGRFGGGASVAAAPSGY